MKYVAFLWYEWDSDGGWNDILRAEDLDNTSPILRFGTVEEAAAKVKERMEPGRDNYKFQIVNLETGLVVQED